MSYMDFDIIHVPHTITCALHYIDGISMAQLLRKTSKCLERGVARSVRCSSILFSNISLRIASNNSFFNLLFN